MFPLLGVLFLDHLLKLVRFLAQLREGLPYGIGFFSPFLAVQKSIFPFRLSKNDGNCEYCASCTRPHASCKGRGVYWYELSLGL
jgi:hypothetical protein